VRLPGSIRKLLLGFVVVLVLCFAAYLRFHHSKPPLEVAYVGNRQIIVWNTSAEVREEAGTLNYGDRVDILDRFRDQVDIRAKGDVKGWVADSDLIPAGVWQKAQDLEARTAKLPMEAQGHTRVLGNLHIEASRDSPHVRQLNKGVAVDMFERQAVEVPTAAAPAPPSPPAHSDDADASSEPAAAKKEDWWLVRAHLADQTTVTGWILGRFLSLDVPSPLPDYASSAGFHVVAWFELNRVADSAGNARPQYLVVGIRGPEGQPCDFTLLRVFTWGKQSQRYETAFVDSNLCGKLPVQLAQPASNGDGTFAFSDWSSGASKQRAYRMHQTVVRRVRDDDSPPAKRKNRHG
jgi:hypothetical protein